MDSFSPHFLGIGVQKGGTSKLFKLLSESKNLFLPAKKEIHFFTYNYNKGVDWYESHFKGKSDYQLSGEFTPYYSFHPLAVSRIRSLYPQTKLILLVRDPIKRAVSQYFHSYRLGFEKLNIFDAFMSENARLSASLDNIITNGFDTMHQENSYLSRSKYDIQIKNILKVFPASQLLICKSEDLYTNPAYILEKLSRFLGVQIDFNNNNEYVHKGKYFEISQLELNQVKLILEAELEKTYGYMKEQFDIHWE